MKPPYEFRPKIYTDAPRPLKRAVSTSGEPSSGAGLQAQAPQADTGSETPASRRGHISKGPRSGKSGRKAKAKHAAPTAGEFIITKRNRANYNAYMRRYRKDHPKVKL